MVLIPCAFAASVVAVSIIIHASVTAARGDISATWSNLSYTGVTVGGALIRFTSAGFGSFNCLAMDSAPSRSLLNSSSTSLYLNFESLRIMRLSCFLKTSKMMIIVIGHATTSRILTTRLPISIKIYLYLKPVCFRWDTGYLVRRRPAERLYRDRFPRPTWLGSFVFTDRNNLLALLRFSHSNHLLFVYFHPYYTTPNPLPPPQSQPPRQRQSASPRGAHNSPSCTR